MPEGLWVIKKQSIFLLHVSVQQNVFNVLYPVAVEQLDRSEYVKLASHEELNSQLSGQRGHAMLTCPLVYFLQKLSRGLKKTYKRPQLSQTGRK